MEFNIKIAFSRSKSPFKIGSLAIAESEKRPYSHAFIVFTDPVSQIELVFQASHGYVNVVNYEIFKEENLTVKQYSIDVSQEKFIEFYKFMDSNLGRKYSVKQILWLFFAKLLQIKHWPSNIYRLIKNDKMEEICSELAMRVFELVKDKYPIPENIQIEQFTPSDLDNFLEKTGLTCEVLNVG